MILVHNSAMKTLAAGALVLALSAAATAQSTINIPFEAYTLPNGLNVVLSIDRTTPTVAVNIWYHVGSKNEMPGRTGFAHLFEHVMFTGSGHVPYGVHDRLTEGAGGMNNGSTSNDITTYYETVPSNYLETMLWIEADRMGYLLDSLDLAKLNAQRDIVKNERRQRVDNQPYGRVYEIFSKAMYPPSHPYSWPVIGSMEDLSAASEEDVKNFFRLYYAPNNAYLTIVGDFDPARGKGHGREVLRRHSARQADHAPDGRPCDVEIGRSGWYSRIACRCRACTSSGRLSVKRTTTGLHCPVLGAILSGPRTARLTKALVFDEQAAASVNAGQNTSEDVGEFMVSITPRPGHSLGDLEIAADAVIERLKREGRPPKKSRRQRPAKSSRSFAGSSRISARPFSLRTAPPSTATRATSGPNIRRRWR